MSDEARKGGWDRKLAAEEILDQFEEACRNGSHPYARDWLLKHADLWDELGVHLLQLEYDYRRHQGETPQVTDYADLPPEWVAQVFQIRDDSRNKAATEESAAHEGLSADDSRWFLPLPEFVRQLEDLNLVSGDSLRALIKGSRSSSKTLAKELVAMNLLTHHQVEKVLQGHGRDLRIGKYIIQDLLGEGGMGKVYRGRNTRLNQSVAIKELSTKLTNNTQAVRRFQREIRLSARASHPNLVTALDAEEHEGRLYLVMEYVAGQDLSRYVKDNGPLSVAEAVETVCQAAEGLRAAHDLGILHRDIKPGNLMRTGSGQVKVLDLGLASCHDSTEPGREGDRTSLQLTGTGMFLGTPDYMSPEQATDGRLADARSDLYSLGCTLYALLVGQAPYHDQSGVQKLMAHSSLPIPSLESVRPDVPPGLVKVYQRLMAKAPGDRYASCGELLEDLRRLQALGLSAKPGRPKAGRPSRTATPVPVGEPASPSWPALKLDDAPPRMRRAGARISTKERRVNWLVWGAVVAAPLVVLSGLWWLMPAPRQILRVAVDPPDAVAQLVDGAGQQVAFGSARKSLVELRAPAGSYMLEVSRDGFDRQRQEITLPVKGNALDKPVRLVRSEGEIIPEVEPEDLKLWYHTREYTAWIERLRLLDGGRQLEELKQKIRELNPEAKASLHVEPISGAPKSLHMNSVGLRDLSPFRAIREVPFLRTIRSLVLNSPPHSRLGTIEDLSPLRGINLEGLDLSSNSLKSISPLRGMPLEWLNLGNTNVIELEPLAACRQLRYLSLFRSECQSLEPLRHLQLETLILEETPFDFANLEPLKDMTSLRHLNLRQNKSIKGLYHLEKVRLVSLAAQECRKLESLEGLNTSELQDLNIESSPITSLEPLAGATRLVQLTANQTGISDLRPLAKLTLLQSLSVYETPVSDLSPLKSLPQLKRLEIKLPEAVQGPLWNQVQGLPHLETLNKKPWDPAKPAPR